MIVGGAGSGNFRRKSAAVTRPRSPSMTGRCAEFRFELILHRLFFNALEGSIPRPATIFLVSVLGLSFASILPFGRAVRGRDGFATLRYWELCHLALIDGYDASGQAVANTIK